MIPTFIGITLAVFVITHFVPGRSRRAPDHALPDGGDDRRRRRRGGGESGRVAARRKPSRRSDGTTASTSRSTCATLQWLGNVVRLDLGNSYIYQEPVWDVIKSRFPVSIFLGLTGFLLSYLVCVPLGVLKAIRTGSRSISSAASSSFSAIRCRDGRSAPRCSSSSAAGVSGVSFRSAGSVPTTGSTCRSRRRSSAQLHHMFLPVLCYMVGSFATLTILTKNSLLENLGQDYVRTAFAKGLRERRVIFVHALRNSLIPIATGLGHVFSLILAGSFLIERVFNIDGMGYLGTRRFSSVTTLSRWASWSSAAC